MTPAYLLLDIGNTRAKAAWWEQGRLELITDLLEPFASKPTAVYYASVASDERVETFKQELGLTDVQWIQVRSESCRDGLHNSYQLPLTLGVDRWLAMLGAWQLYPANELLVVDAGTALTIDHVSALGCHQGGWIVPGIRMQQKAVTNYTAKVFNRDQQHFSLELGRDTSSCLQNGVFAAIVAVIKQANLLLPQAKILLTGGDAFVLEPFLAGMSVEIDPLLVFRGMTRYIDI